MICVQSDKDKDQIEFVLVHVNAVDAVDADVVVFMTLLRIAVLVVAAVNSSAVAAFFFLSTHPEFL